MPYARGQPITLDGATYYVQEPKDKTVAGLFAFFLGGLGIHHFYNRQPGWGILYILFIWTFIPSAIAFFEALWFWFSSEEAFYKHHKHLLTGFPAHGAWPMDPPTAWPQPEAIPAGTAVGSVQKELLDWKHMLDSGIITQEEFNRKKSDLLTRG